MTSHAETCKTAAEPLARTITTVGRAVGTRIRQVFLAFKHRRDFAALASFDDRMLADIGLTRSDLREAVSEPLWRDPTAILVNRVDVRRWARRRTSRAPSGRMPAAPSLVPEVAGARATGQPVRVL